MISANRKRIEIDHHSTSIIPLADIHAGSKEHSKKLFEKTIKMIRDTENCYSIGLGDLIEAAGLGKIGREKDQDIQLDGQIEYICDSLTPIKDKILFLISGNHEARSERAIGLDITKIISDILGIPYYGWESKFLLSMKSRRRSSARSGVRLFAHHGKGGSSTQGGKVNSAESLLSRSPNADLIISGHSHISVHTSREFRDINMFGFETTKLQHFVVCGTAHGSDGYAAMKAYSPVPKMQVRIDLKLDNDDKLEVQKYNIYE